MLPQQPSGRLEVQIDLLDKSERQKGSVFHMWDNEASGNYCLFAGKSKGSEIISQKGVGCTFRDHTGMGTPQSPVVALKRSCTIRSTSPFFSIEVSDWIRFSYAARTNDENSGWALKGFDLYSGWNCPATNHG